MQVGQISSLMELYNSQSMVSSMLPEVSDGTMEGTDQISLSPRGRMMSAMSGLSDEERAEMKAFHDQVFESVENGTFDAEELAEAAPASLTAIAEEKGLEVTEMLENMADRMEQHGGRRPPAGPPPGGNMLYGPDAQAASTDQDTLLTALLEMLSASGSSEDSSDWWMNIESGS